MNVDRKWIVIRLSIVLPLVSTIASFVMSMFLFLYHWHDLMMVAGSIVSMAVAGIGFCSFFKVLGTADGLNAPHAIPERTKHFLLIAVMNLTLFSAEIILF